MVSHRFRLLVALFVVAAQAPLAAQQVRRTLPGTRADTTAAVRPPQQPDGSPQKATFGVIDGLVTDSSLVPLRGARVSIVRTLLQVATGPNGRFRILDVPSGQYIVIVRRAGFHPTSAVLQVNGSDTLRLSYTLQQAPAELAPVIIAEQQQSFRMKEFEYRRKLGVGEFMTAEQIEKHNSAYVTELLRMFTSINVTPTSGGGGQDVYYPVSSRATGGMTSTGQAACFMIVYVDNVPMPAPFNLDMLPAPAELAGIEVYAGASETPLQFASLNTSCGVILIWTKDGVTQRSKP
jgi:hypothetical protein